MSSASSWRGSRGLREPSFRRFRGGFSDRSRRNEEPQPQTPPPPYGELLVEIKREDISESPYNPKIRDCNYIASYSWLDGGTQAILIPGKPPAWTPPAINRRLEPDKGNFFRDPNAARYPNYPMEPAVRAVLKQNPQFPTEEVDIFTCASALGNLSRFVRGVERGFRFVMEMVGNTVFFIRRENSPTELIPNVRGYGHTFPEEYTSWGKDVRGSESHQRIVQYVFGKFCLVVRFEADGYFRNQDETPGPILNSDSLIDAFGGASVSRVLATSQKGLQIKEGGQPIPQKDIFDIKTRSQFDFQTRTIKKEIDMTDIIPRLWVSQIPNLIVGFHDRGLFEDIRVQDMRGEVAQWEENNKENLRQLVSLLQELVEFARTSKTNLEICRSETGPLEIRRLAGEGLEALPSEVKARWVGKEGRKKVSLEDVDSLNSKSGLGGGTCLEADPRIRDYGGDSDEESVKDYTACSLEDCGYCGHCPY